MEDMDQEKARQVWQRVKPAPQPGMELRAMQLAAMENGAVYRSLAARFVGLPRQQMGLLLEHANRETAILAGMGLLSGGQSRPGKPLLPTRGTAAEALKGCYHRSRRSLVEYTARWTDPEFGCLFQSLSQTAQESCALIAQVLGQIG